MAAGWLLVGGAALAAGWLLGPLSAALMGSAAALVFGGVHLAVQRALVWHLPQMSFGPANGVTLTRAIIVALLAGLLAGLIAPLPWSGQEAGLSDPWAWAAVVLATVAALLDAVDGPLARRYRSASAFGARFDMEVDALLILVLSLLLWQSGNLGAWVLLSAAMRYLFVAAGRLWPALCRPLPPSTRRQAVCVTQVVCLIVALGPIVPPALGAVLVGASIALAAWSFWKDLRWLARAAGPQQETSV